MAKDIKKLKDKVESHGFLWGIIDKEEYHDIMICSITSAIKSNNNLSWFVMVFATPKNLVWIHTNK